MHMKKIIGLISVLLIATMIFAGAGSATIVHSGDCGDNLTWTLDDAGLLTIQGTGGMNDSPEFLTYKADIKSVEIGLGATSIGKQAFYGCTNLQKVHIGSSVITIGENAFNGCSQLSDINIPESVTTISKSSFEGCKVLNTITIGNGVTHIYDYAFKGCSGLTNVNFGTGLNRIHKNAFEGCTNLTNVVIPENIKSIDEYAFNGCTSLETVDIGNGVTDILEYAFNGCSQLKTVHLGENVQIIGDHAFYNCSLLSDINIPESVTTISESSFEGCKALKTITIGNGVTHIYDYAFKGCSGLTNVNFGTGLNRIHKNAFEDCTNLTNVVIPENIKSIDEYAFNGCTSLETVDIGNGVTDILKYAFNGCSQLKTVHLGENVQIIGDHAFYNCSLLSDINIPERVTTISESLFEGCTALKTITIGNGVTHIYDYAFKNCSGLTNVNFGTGLNRIHKNAFEDCTNLTNVIIPENVKSIDEYAFNGCTSLKTVDIAFDEATIETDAFKNLASNSIIYIKCDSSALSGKYSTDKTAIAKDNGNNSFTFTFDTSKFSSGFPLDSANYPSKVGYTFDGWYDNPSYTGEKLTNVSNGVPIYAKWNKVEKFTVTFSGDSHGSVSATVGGSPIVSGTDVSAGSTVVFTIAPESGYQLNTFTVNGFKEKSQIYSGKYTVDNLEKNISISATFLEKPLTKYTVTFNGDSHGSVSATVGGSSIVSGTDVPAGSTVVFTIAPESGYQLNTFSVNGIDAKSQVSGETYSFSNLSNVVSVVAKFDVIPPKYAVNFTHGTDGTITAFVNGKPISSGTEVYSGSSITFKITPDLMYQLGTFTVNSIDKKSDVSSGIYIINNLTEAKTINSTFESASIVHSGTCSTGLDWKLYSNGLLSISGTGAIPDSPDWLTYNEDIKSVLIGSNVTSIGENAFKNCYQLSDINIPDSVNTISTSSFEGCTALKTITIGNGVTHIYDYAFKGCSGLTQVNFGTKLDTIHKNAFENCTNLVSVEIPDNVKSIDEYAFKDCTSLETLTIGDGVTDIKDYAFSGCSQLQTVNLGKKVNIIGEYAFYNCSQLSSINIPDSVTTISKSSFEGCKSLKTITIGNGVTHIYDYAFKSCSGLTQVTFGTALETIHKNAFDECTNIVNVVIPGNVKSIDEYAFNDCTSLKMITIGDGVTTIGKYAFNGCSQLITVQLGKKVQVIGDHAFYNCSQLSDINIPESVTTISESSFEGCTALKTITIGNGVTHIYDYAFKGCSWLTQVNFGTALDTIHKNAFEECTNLTNVIIPENVKSIDEYAFNGCTSLKTVDIAYEEATIGTDAFKNLASNSIIYIKCDSSSISGKYSTDKTVVAKDNGNGSFTFTLDVSKFTSGFPLNSKNSPSKVGYAFDGWYDNPSCTGEKVTSVTINPTTLYTKWVATQYTVNFSGDTHGTVTATAGGSSISTGAQVDSGSTVVFTISPNQGYQLNTFTVNGVDKKSQVSSGTYTISNLSETTTVAATFEIIPTPKYTVSFSGDTYGTVTATAGGSSISTGAQVDSGSTVVFTISPNQGYQLKTFTVNGVDKKSQVSSGTYTISNLSEATTVAATFEIIPTPKYTVSFSGDTYGTVTATAGGSSISTGTQVDSGSTVVFTISPNQGYQLKTFTVNGVDKKSQVSSGTYTISNLSEATTVAATFETVPTTKYTVSFSGDANGTVTATAGGSSISTGAQVDSGSTVVFTISPNQGYQLKTFTVNSVDKKSQVSSGTYTIGSLTESTTVAATFETVPTVKYTVNFSGDTNGTVTATAGGSSISTGAQVDSGSTVVFTISPSQGYQLKTFTVNGIDKKSQVSSGTYTISNLSEATTVAATFETSTTGHAVNAATITGTGTVTYSTTLSGTYTSTLSNVTSGTTVYIKAAPGSGWTTSSSAITFGSSSVTTTSTANVYQASMPASDVTPTVTFTQSTTGHAVNAATITGTGTVTYSTTLSGTYTSTLSNVTSGTTVYIKAVPGSSWTTSASAITFGSSSVTTTSTANVYQASMPASDVTPTVTFTQSTTGHAVNAATITGTGTVTYSTTLSGTYTSTLSNVTSGTTVYIKAAPGSGWTTSSSAITFGSSSVTTTSTANVYQASMPASDVTPTVTFTQSTTGHAVNAATITGTGTVTYSTTLSGTYTSTLSNVTSGTTVYIKAVPGSGWTTSSSAITFGSSSVTTTSTANVYQASMPASDVTPTVTFTQGPVTKYTVSFNSNGGTGSMADQEFTKGISQSLNENLFTRNGYKFGGWSTGPRSSMAYGDKAEYLATEDTTLYAYWLKNSDIIADVPTGIGSKVVIETSKESGSVSSVSFNGYTNGLKLMFKKASEVSTSEPKGTLVSKFEINVVDSSGSEIKSGLSALISFYVDKSDLSGKSPSSVKLAHWINDTLWTYLIPDYTEDGNKYLFTAEVTGFSPFAIVIQSDEPTPSHSSSSSVTSFTGEKSGNDFIFNNAVVVTKATLPGASSAKITNGGSGKGWYNFNLSSSGLTGNGILYFQVPLDVISIKGYTINDVSLIGCTTKYLTTEGQYAKYSAVITKDGSYTIDFEEGAAKTTSSTSSSETKPVEVTVSLSGATSMKVGDTTVFSAKNSDGSSAKFAWKSSDDSIASVDENGNVKALKEGNVTITVTNNVTGKTASKTITVSKMAEQTTQTTTKSPFPVLGILLGLGIASSVALRRK